MNEKYCCVLDAAGWYKTFVLVLLNQDESGETVEQIQYYAMTEGETLIDALPPTFIPCVGGEGFVFPRWNGETWVEGATLEEIAAWEAEHPAPIPDTTPTMEQRTAALEAAMLAVMGGEGNF